LKIYLGVKEGKRPEIIQSDTRSTKETHPQFDFYYGSFKSFDEPSAYVKAMTGLACGTQNNTNRNALAKLSATHRTLQR
jgi:hypothetical protein